MNEYLGFVSMLGTLAAVTISYISYQLVRKQKFQDKLFELKLDAYNKINTACYNALMSFDINSHPYSEIYNYKKKEDWVKYCESSMGAELKIAFNLEDEVYAHAVYLPNSVVEKVTEFSQECLSFVSGVYNFNVLDIMNNHERIAIMYIDIVNLMRADLKIEQVDAELSDRISGKKVEQ